jgi:hypothetical protein
VSQVASYDHQFRVVVMGVNIGHRGAERDRRIQPVEPFAGRYEMRMVRWINFISSCFRRLEGEDAAALSRRYAFFIYAAAG